MIRDGDHVVDYWKRCSRCGEWARAMGRELGITDAWTEEDLMVPVKLETTTCPCGHTTVIVPPTYERVL